MVYEMNLMILLAIVVIAFGGLMTIYIIERGIPNWEEHEDLRYMTCDDNPAEWARTHTQFVDHQAFARQLAVACEIGTELPPFGGH